MAYCRRRRRHVLRRHCGMGLAHRPTFLRKKQSPVAICVPLCYNGTHQTYE